MLLQTAPRVPVEERAAAKGFRGDVQGLRALAVLLVVLDHAGVQWLPGGFVGVDVFFVISGYVITGSLLRGSDRHRVSLSQFYAARARRILPMATLVLLVTVLAAGQLLNFVRAGRVVTDTMWAGLFAANIHFSAIGTDYFAADLPPSPVQHYWSLAVEEQFYLVWPLLLFLLIRGWRPRHRSRRADLPERRIAVCLAAILAVSLLWSVRHTAADPTGAFFGTATRAWELAAGALLAVGGGVLTRVPGRALLPWAGLGMIAAAAVFYGPGTPFPGGAALLPVLGTVAVLAGTGNALLELRPVRAVGDVSFSFYLWHWPALVLAAGYAEQDLSVGTNLLLVAGALVVSFGSYRFVETPFRTARWLRRDRSTSLLLWPVAVIALLMVCLSTTTVLRARTDSRNVEAAAAPVPDAGPRATRSGDPVIAAVQQAVAAANAGRPVPARLSPAIDRIGADIDYSMCFARPADVSVEMCPYGDPKATRSLAVVGDSHGMMWFAPLNALGRKYGWKVYAFFKPSCPPAGVTVYAVGRGPVRGCDQWRSQMLRAVAELKPDRVVVANHAPRQADDEGREITDSREWNRRWRDGIAATSRTLAAAGAAVTVLGDVPGVKQDPTECLLGRRATLRACTFERNVLGGRHNQLVEDGARQGGAKYIDPLPWFCADARCPTVVGNMVVYADSNHLSKTYALYLTDALGRALGLRTAR